MFLNEDDKDDAGLSLRINFYSRYDGTAEKLKQKLITDKWNQLKTTVLKKKKAKKRKKKGGMKKKKKNRYKKVSKREKHKNLN
jgi:chromatin segregation and condensation protein Rec8/ScpA/Scc1 (kleisin family)